MPGLPRTALRAFDMAVYWAASSGQISGVKTGAKNSTDRSAMVNGFISQRHQKTFGLARDTSNRAGIHPHHHRMYHGSR